MKILKLSPFYWFVILSIVFQTSNAQERSISDTTIILSLKVFNELDDYYLTGKAPDYMSWLDGLSSKDSLEQYNSGQYLLAAFRQLHDDEINGWDKRIDSPFWGVGSYSMAGSLMDTLIKKFNIKAAGFGSLPPALWLLNDSTNLKNREIGLAILKKINPPNLPDIIREQLNDQFTNNKTTVMLLNAIGEMKYKDMTELVLDFSFCFRDSVRYTAREVLEQLDYQYEIDDFDPVDMVPDWLDGQMKLIPQMIMDTIPENAKWVTIERSDEYKKKYELGLHKFSGWLLGQDSLEYNLLDYFARNVGIKKSAVKFEEGDFEDDIDYFDEIRSSKDFDAMGQLSSKYTTSFYEPYAIKLPEALVSAWAWERGEKDAAAKLIHNRINLMDDDKMFLPIVRDYLGNYYHIAMLAAFSYERDYAKTIELANHISKPIFNGYYYQDRAIELKEQLQKRLDDFKTFSLPTEEEWNKFVNENSKEQQIKYLANRLRLLNCFQPGQPAGISYSDPQYGTTGPDWNMDDSLKPLVIINPYNELIKMELSPGDLINLIPYINDNNYIPSFSYWRDFTPGRTLHRVSWVAATIINYSAKNSLVDLKLFVKLSDANKEKYIDSLITWCRENSDKTMKELLLSSMKNTNDWKEFSRRAGEAVSRGYSGTLPILVERFDDFTDERAFPGPNAEIVRLAYDLNDSGSVDAARKWLKNEDKDVVFWSAMILLNHGDRQNLEGLDKIEDVLKNDDGSYLYPKAIDILVSFKNEKALGIAEEILEKRNFNLYFTGNYILRLLFTHDSEKSLKYIINELSNGELDSYFNDEEGNRIDISKGDEMARIITGWSKKGMEYNVRELNEDEREKQKEFLKEWITEQFKLIKSGWSTILIRNSKECRELITLLIHRND